MKILPTWGRGEDGKKEMKEGGKVKEKLKDSGARAKRKVTREGAGLSMSPRRHWARSQYIWPEWAVKPKLQKDQCVDLTKHRSQLRRDI